jgi:hypothetical protein
MPDSNGAASAELKGSKTLTVGLLRDAMSLAQPQAPLGVLIAELPEAVQMFCDQTGAHSLFTTMAPVPEGTVWGGTPVTQVAFAMVLLPEAATRLVADRSDIKLVKP